MTKIEPVRPPSRRRATATSSFGVGRREAHDSSSFYARFTPPRLSADATVVSPAAQDVIWTGDARQMNQCGDIADNSVALVVTSPPYFAGKEYEAVLGVGHVPADYAAYLGMLHDVFALCFDKLEPGGRIAVNVANLGRKPYRSLSRDVIDLLERLGFLLRGEILWRKSQAAGGSCAWGTYQRPGNPVLRDLTERIVVASKGRFDRAQPPEQRAQAGLPHEATISMDEFIDATTDIWDIPSESATRVGHPAPFPVELPRRLIDLYTYRGDLVLDPFMGSGSTAVAAVRTERHYAGFDTDPTYVALAEQRVDGEKRKLAADEAAAARRITVVPAGLPRPDVDGLSDEAAAMALGHKARQVAHQSLVSAGFTSVETDVLYGDLGVGIDFRARDAGGDVWLFDLCGGFSATRPGLRRPDVLWRALGKASVIAEARRQHPSRVDLGPVILLSTDLPPQRSAGGRALDAVKAGGSGPVVDALELLSADCGPRLAHYALGRAGSGKSGKTRKKRKA